MDENYRRSWCIQICYPDKKPALLGNIFVSHKATQTEVEEECCRVADEHIPTGYKVIDLIPGSLWFSSEESLT